MEVPSRTKKLLRIAAFMPIQSERALENFTGVNPNWQGAHWPDCLDALDDSDSHLEITEPLWDTLTAAYPMLTDEQRAYIGLVAVTLHWSYPAKAVDPAEVVAWLEVLG